MILEESEADTRHLYNRDDGKSVRVVEGGFEATTGEKLTWGTVARILKVPNWMSRRRVSISEV